MKQVVVFLLLVILFVPAIAAPDTPEEFSNWFIQQSFQGQEYYQWIAVFEALTDGKDRSREARIPISNPVYVAILTGDKYHLDENCSFLNRASHILKMDISEAQNRRFEICSKCGG